MTKPSNHNNRSNKGKYQNVPVILRRLIWNFNIPPPGQPQGPWTLNFEDWFVQIPTPGTKIVFKCLTHIFFKGKISDRNFLHIDQALKPRRCRPFLLNHLPARVKLFTLNTFIFKDRTLVSRRKELTLTFQISHPVSCTNGSMSKFRIYQRIIQKKKMRWLLGLYMLNT